MKDKYVMSPEDLCTIDFLDKVLESRVSVLKIEGRARSSEYVFIVVSAYRKALDAIENGKYDKELIDELFQDLRTVYNRGLSKGFFFGRPVGAWSKSYGSKATTRKIFIGKVLHHFPKAKVVEVEIQSGTLKVGDKIYIIGNTTGVLKQDIAELRDAEENKISEAKKGEVVTFSVSEKVRENDQVYVIEKVSEDDLKNAENERLRDRLQGY